MQICRVTAERQFQTITAKTWHAQGRKSPNHAGFPSKTGESAQMKFQKYILDTKQEIHRYILLKSEKLSFEPAVIFGLFVIKTMLLLVTEHTG